ncbi:MAG: hypothetical protein PHT77_05640 [Bacteroidales bacterium]|nr:hypothetical protein [Bacteroidales bacterium]
MMNKTKWSAQGIIVLLCLGIFLFSGCTKPGTEKQILSFVFNELDPPVEGIINEPAHTIAATVPTGTDVSGLAPIITLSDQAEVTPESGIPNDFSMPVSYTVTAEDGSEVIYIVTVTIEGGGSSDDPQYLEGEMSENTTLKNRNNGIDYIINNWLYVDGNAMLTIEAGVTIAFASASSGIDIHENAGIHTAGAENNPVVFTGPVNNQNPGSWYALIIRSARNDNALEYTSFLNGGASVDFGIIEIECGAKVAMRNCLISNSSGYGIFFHNATGDLIAFENNEISNCAKGPIYASGLHQTRMCDLSNLMQDNPVPYIRVSQSDIDENLTLEATTVPRFIDEYDIYVTKTLTLEAGVTLYMNADRSIDINESTGKLIINGTTDLPVILTRMPGETYFWGGIYVRSDIGTTLQHCHIDYAGRFDEEAAVWLGWDAGITLSDVEIAYSKNYGFAHGEEYSITHSNVIFTDCTLENVYNYETGEVSDTLP